MGKIVTTTSDRFGKKTRTEVHINRFTEFLIHRFAGRFGHKFEWRVVKRIERRKLRKR